MSLSPIDPTALVARARREGSVDLGGLRLDIDPAAETLFVSCSGLNPPGHIVYAHEYTQLDQALHRLFVSDTSNRWFLGGVPGVTGSIDATIALLGALIAQLRPARSIAIGTSMGGYLSLLLGCAGLVDEAVAFSPQTTLDPAWRHAHGDRRWRTEIDAGIAALAPLPPPDVASRAAAPAGRGARLHLFYPTGEALDVAHALRLADAPNVVLYGVATCHHVVSGFLKHRGVLRQVIESIIAGGTPLEVVRPLRDDADDPERAYRDGLDLLRRDEDAAAEQAFRRAVAGALPLPHYFAGLAEAVWRQGRLEEAVQVGRDAVAVMPDEPHRRLTLTALAQRHGLFDEAEANLRAALRLAPDDRRFAEELCAFLVARGRAGEALSVAREAFAAVREADLFRDRIDALLGLEWREEW